MKSSTVERHIPASVSGICNGRAARAAVADAYLLVVHVSTLDMHSIACFGTSFLFRVAVLTAGRYGRHIGGQVRRSRSVAIEVAGALGV